MFCQTEAEAFADSARDLIFQVARPYLERQAITTVELIYDPARHRLLLDDGARFQEILQRIALLQGQRNRRPVNERMHELTALAEAGMQRIADWAETLPSVANADQALRDGLLADDSMDGQVRAGITLSRLLRLNEDWSARALLCLDLIEAGVQGASRAMIDQTLAEMLRMKAAAASLFGDINRRRMIEICLYLAGEDRAVEVGPALTRLRQSLPLPHCQAAIRERLTEMLNGTLPLFHAEPHHEWQALQDLKQRIAALSPLAEEAIFSQLHRRFGRFVAPEQLNPVLAVQPDIAHKLLFLMRLYHDVIDGNARFELLGVFNHYLEHRDFKSQFLGPQAAREDFADLVREISELVAKADIVEQRKTRLLALFRDQLIKVVKPAGRRLGQRGLGGPNDVVEVSGVRMHLHNWSMSGLLFGPCPGGVEVGDHLPIKVVIRNPVLALDFDAEAVVLRITDDLVAARYKLNDAETLERVRAYFAAA